MALPLAGRVAIVTGSSRGIGRAIAAHLASLGASLVINYASSSAQADLLVSELNSNSTTVRAIAVQADVSDPSGAKTLFDRAEEAFGSPVHIFVNSAGVIDSEYSTISSMSLEDFDKIFNVNARGAFLCCQEAANRIARGGGGRIIMVSSSLVGALLPNYGAYTASKAAVEAMVKILAKEIKGTKITVNCLAPGPIATELFLKGKSEEDVKTIADKNPMGRIGETKDVAPIVGFLCIWTALPPQSHEPGQAAPLTTTISWSGQAVDSSADGKPAEKANLVINFATNSTQTDHLVSQINSNSTTVHAIAVHADVSDPSGAKTLFDRAEEAFGCSVHIFVNSAEVIDTKYSTISSTSVEVFDKIFNVSARGAFLYCQETANRIVHGGGGRIIMITTSLVAAPLPKYGAYTASKAGVEAMTKILARELKGTRIIANCVVPGAVATDLFFEGKGEEDVKKTAMNPMGRIGETKDVAPLVGFLCTDEGEWVNGGSV